MERARQFAWSEAAKIEEIAREVGKPTNLVGFEVDFENKYPTGIDYYVKTTDGKTYVLQNIGANFATPGESFVPATVYGRFNTRC